MDFEKRIKQLMAAVIILLALVILTELKLFSLTEHVDTLEQRIMTLEYSQR